MQRQSFSLNRRMLANNCLERDCTMCHQFSIWSVGVVMGCPTARNNRELWDSCAIFSVSLAPKQRPLCQFARHLRSKMAVLWGRIRWKPCWRFQHAVEGAMRCVHVQVSGYGVKRTNPVLLSLLLEAQIQSSVIFLDLKYFGNSYFTWRKDCCWWWRLITKFKVSLAELKQLKSR